MYNQFGVEYSLGTFKVDFIFRNTSLSAVNIIRHSYGPRFCEQLQYTGPDTYTRINKVNSWTDRVVEFIK